MGNVVRGQTCATDIQMADSRSDVSTKQRSELSSVTALFFLPVTRSSPGATAEVVVGATVSTGAPMGTVDGALRGRQSKCGTEKKLMDGKHEGANLKV